MNGVPDLCDIAQGTSDDVNGNGIPDECEIPSVIPPSPTSALRSTISTMQQLAGAHRGASAIPAHERRGHESAALPVQRGERRTVTFAAQPRVAPPPTLTRYWQILYSSASDN
jgi:hypothetical protein